MPNRIQTSGADSVLFFCVLYIYPTQLGKERFYYINNLLECILTITVRGDAHVPVPDAVHGKILRCLVTIILCVYTMRVVIFHKRKEFLQGLRVYCYEPHYFCTSP